jgi:hypothetical protein
MTDYQDPWPNAAAVADAEITDREGYEQLCLAFLRHLASGEDRWRKNHLELLEASLVGSYPNTRLRALLSWPSRKQPQQFEWPIWQDDGEAHVASKGGPPVRWTPPNLVQNYLEDVYYMID